MKTGWRAMADSDLAAALAVADVVHQDYPERPEVFAERLRLFPAGCRIAAADDGTVLGYGLSHPGRLGRPPELDSLLGALPVDADCLYLHDVALLPAARGLGLGGAALAEARALAVRCGVGWLALTATAGALAYWQRAGFVPFGPVDAVLAARLATYGAGLTYMTAPA